MLMSEIARLAGVSTATVSRVMHDSPLVKRKTADRVREVMAQARYFPNNTATSLRSGRSRIYGLIIPDLTNPFFPEFIKAFETIAIRNEQEILLANTDFHPAGMQMSIQRMLTRQVEGIAIMVSELSEETTDALIKNRVPAVTFDRRHTSAGFSDVKIDNRPGIEEAVEHLKALGHTRIAYIGGTAAEPVSSHRLNTVARALKKHGLVLRPELTLAGDWRVSGGEQAMRALLELNRSPTAILAANDLTALGAMRVIHERGYSVPEDFSVIGFDNIGFAELSHPPLTSVAMPREELAQAFFTSLEEFERRADKPGRQHAIKTRLIVRRSTAHPPRNRTR